MLLVALGVLPLSVISFASRVTLRAPSSEIFSGASSEVAFTTLTYSFRRFSSRVVQA